VIGFVLASCAEPVDVRSAGRLIRIEDQVMDLRLEFRFELVRGPNRSSSARSHRSATRSSRWAIGSGPGLNDATLG
jgi:hypothetical protein